MKTFTRVLLIFIISVSSKLSAQNVAINSTGNNADASAMLDVSSTTSGFLMPRMTTAQRDAIVLPATGLSIFNTTAVAYEINTGTPAAPVWSTISTNSWNLNGNTGTNSGANFIGTSDSRSLSFSTNNIQRMYIDSSTGNVGIGTNTPGADFTLFQKSGSGGSKGFRFTGNSTGGTNSGTGFSLSLGYNSANNKQLWLGDPDYLGSSSGSFIRYQVNSGVPVLDGVRGDAVTRRPISIGVGGDSNSGIILGADFNGTSPASFVWANGNMTIGNSYRAIGAPANGLIVQGNVGLATTSPTEKLDVTGNIKFSGALMPNNQAGTSGYLLTSAGAGSPPTWTAFSGTAPITYSNGVIGITQATTSTDGYLSSTDWDTFNDKQPAGPYLTDNQTITLSGDVTGSGTTSITTTVGNINGTSLAGLSTGILKNTTGTGVPSIAVAGDFPTLNQNTTGSAATLTTGRTISISGDLVYTSPAFDGSANVSAAGTLATVNSNVGSFTNANITVNGKGLITAASNGTFDTTNISGFSSKVRSLFSATAPVTYSNGLIGITQATSSSNGYLSSTDWNTFNNKADATTSWSTLGNSVASAQTIGTTTNFDFPFITNNTEKMRLSATGNLGIGTTTPAYSLQVVSAANPLYLGGMQSGSNTDSILTIINGVVKRLSPSALVTSSSNAWGLSGNAGTNTGSHFVGTTDNKSLSFRTNNTQRIIIDATGNVGIGTSAFDPSLPEKLLVDAGSYPSNGPTINSTPINAIGASNGFQQIQVQNRSWGNYSSSDLVAAGDGTQNGTAPFNTDTHYVDLGINSSGYTNSNSNILNQPYTAYLYSTTPQHFYIGNGYQGKDLIFFTNYSNTNSNNTADGFELMRLKGGTSVATQQVTIGTATPNGTNKLTVNGSISASAFNVSSDRRLKTNIKSLQYGLKEVLALQPVSYNWKETPSTDKQLGLVAQDAKKEIPEIVSGNETSGTLSINYTELVPVLINAIKEQQQQINDLKKEVELLKSKK